MSSNAVIRFTHTIMERADGHYVRQFLDGKFNYEIGPFPCQLIAEIMRAQVIDNIEMDLEECRSNE
jgi:hypothetical protein